MKRNREDTTFETINLDDLTEEPNSKKLIQNPSHSSSTYYEQGCGYFDNEDYIKPMELFVKGSEERCSECKYKIGYIYDCGLGVKQHYSKAMEWYLKAAENDHVDAQFNIALLYRNGQGVSQDSGIQKLPTMGAGNEVLHSS